MNYKALIEKYWAGKTSLAEEKALKAYFNGDNVAEELIPYQSMFSYFEVAQKQTLDSSVEALIQQENLPKSHLSVQTKRFQFIKVAAAILVLILAGFGYQQTQMPSKTERMATYWASKEIKDPKVALLKTKAALLLVSKKLNNGTEAALQQVAKVQQVGQFIKSPE